MYESDSMGKTAVAMMVGVAVTKGILDIDRPIHEYGVPDVRHTHTATGELSAAAQVHTRVI